MKPQQSRGGIYQQLTHLRDKDIPEFLRVIIDFIRYEILWRFK